MKRKERNELAKILSNAHKKLYSCGCPYLALADEIGFITPYVVKHNPSNFGRLSMNKIIQCGGFDTQHSQFIFECLELGFSLEKVSKILTMDYKKLCKVKEYVKDEYNFKNSELDLFVRNYKSTSKTPIR